MGELPLLINTNTLSIEELELFKRDYTYKFERDDEDEFIILLELL